MSVRPTALYPAAPKPEWFMRHASNMSHMNGSLSVSNSSTPGAPGETVSLDSWDPIGATSFVKMNQNQYIEYLDAHRSWYASIIEIDAKEHDRALLRRAFTKVTEKAEVLNVVETSPLPTRSLPVPEDDDIQVVVSLAKKEAHAPTLSTKPHRAEKRANKVKLANAKTKAAADLLDARATLESDTASRKAVNEALTNIKVHTPLWTAETKAAKTAATRSKAIRFGSTDLVTNIEAGTWKVVSRKKGDNRVESSSITKSTSAAGETTSWQIIQDPAMRVPPALSQAARQPTQVGASVS